MANRSITLSLKAETQGLVNGVKTAQRAAGDAGRSLDEFRRQNEQAWNTVGTTLATAGTAITAGVGLAVKAATDWETAWAGVQKTNEGTEQQMTALEEDLRNLATTLPATHTEIAAVAEAAGQLGVGVDDVSEFTETMINLGETTNLSADEAATALARFSNITGTSFSDVDRLGSSLVDLGNNFATTESEILAMSERVAAAGTQAGLTDGEIMGLAAAMSSVGIEAQAGGTAMTQTFNEIDSAVREGGESLEGWAELAGVSAQEFSSAWQEDPATAITMMVEGLGEVASQGGDVNGTLEDLGINGIRQADTLRRLAGEADNLSDAFNTGNEAFDENSALAEEAALRYETTKARIETAWSGIQDAAITAGETILPVVGGVADIVGDLATRFSDLPPSVSGGITALSGVAGVAAAGAGGLMLLVPRAVETYDAFRRMAPAGSRARGVLKGVGTAASLAAIGVAALEIASAGANNEMQEGMGGADNYKSALERLAQGHGDAEGQINELANSSSWLGGELVDVSHAMHAVDTNGFARAIGSPLGSLHDLTGGLVGVKDTVYAAEGAFDGMDGAITALIEEGNIDAAAAGMQYLSDEAEAAGKPFTAWAREHLPNLSDALLDSGTNMDEFMNALGMQNGYVDAATGKWEQGSISMEEFSNKLSGSEEDAISAALGVENLDEAMGVMDEGAMQAEEGIANLEQSLEEMGIATDGTIESLDLFTTKLFESGLATQSVMQAESAFEAQLDAVDDQVKTLTDSLAEEYIQKGYSETAARELAAEQIKLGHALDDSGASFDNTTQAGRDAESQFFGVADSGRDLAQAMAENDASQDEIQGSLRRTYDSLIETGVGFGMTKGDAEALTREVLDIPEGVDIDSWMSDEAKRTAEETEAAMHRIDGMRTFSEHTHTTTEVTYRQTMISRGIDPTTNNVARATGGRIPKRSGGGRLPYTGMGTDMIMGVNSDGRYVADVDDGEWVVRETSADKYDSVLDRINRDHPSVQHLAGYANNGAVQARQLAAATTAAAGGTTTTLEHRYGDINVAELHVREEADIRKISVELRNLQERDRKAG